MKAFLIASLCFHGIMLCLFGALLHDCNRVPGSNRLFATCGFALVHVAATGWALALLLQ
jgi:hypothetical protein